MLESTPVSPGMAEFRSSGLRGLRHSRSGSFVSGAFYKTKMCPFLLQRRVCNRGAACVYAHAAEELRSAPNLEKTKMCPLQRGEGLCADASCSFAHTTAELRHTADVFKTRICHMWKKGKCGSGALCRHAHGHEELARHRQLAASAFRRASRQHTIAVETLAPRTPPPPQTPPPPLVSPGRRGSSPSFNPASGSPGAQPQHQTSSTLFSPALQRGGAANASLTESEALSSRVRREETALLGGACCWTPAARVDGSSSTAPSEEACREVVSTTLQTKTPPPLSPPPLAPPPTVSRTFPPMTQEKGSLLDYVRCLEMRVAQLEQQLLIRNTLISYLSPGFDISSEGATENEDLDNQVRQQEPQAGAGGLGESISFPLTSLACRKRFPAASKPAERDDSFCGSFSTLNSPLGSTAPLLGCLEPLPLHGGQHGWPGHTTGLSDVSEASPLLSGPSLWLGPSDVLLSEMLRQQQDDITPSLTCEASLSSPVSPPPRHQKSISSSLLSPLAMLDGIPPSPPQYPMAPVLSTAEAASWYHQKSPPSFWEDGDSEASKAAMALVTPREVTGCLAGALSRRIPPKGASPAEPTDTPWPWSRSPLSSPKGSRISPEEDLSREELP